MKIIKNLKQISGCILVGVGAGVILGQAIEGVFFINMFDALGFGIIGIVLMSIGVIFAEDVFDNSEVQTS